MARMKQLATELQELIDAHGADVVRAAVYTLLACECRKCGNVWTPRGTDRPRMCPRCKNPGWYGEVDHAAHTQE